MQIRNQLLADLCATPPVSAHQMEGSLARAPCVGIYVDITRRDFREIHTGKNLSVFPMVGYMRIRQGLDIFFFFLINRRKRKKNSDLESFWPGKLWLCDLLYVIQKQSKT